MTDIIIISLFIFAIVISVTHGMWIYSKGFEAGYKKARSFTQLFDFQCEHCSKNNHIVILPDSNISIEEHRRRLEEYNKRNVPGKRNRYQNG